MDIVTQGILGAAAAQAVFARRLPRSAWIIGFVSGLLADADVFIRPASDPLGGITFHRHFTHSFAFIPIGALIAALPFFLLPAFRRQKKLVYLASLVAYSTHALLDACTSYGTMLFWPFSDVRIAWDLIAIIDLAFTVPLILAVIIGAWRRSPAPAVIALSWCLIYMGFGMVQRDRALDVQHELAAMRGHTIARGRVVPTPLSVALWRSVYITDAGQIVADGVHLPYFTGEPTVQVGSSVPVVTVDDVRRSHPDDAALIAGFERFAWFTDGYTARHEHEPAVIGDMRYVVEPHTFDSLWGYLVDDVVPGPPGSGSTRMVSFRMSRGERFARVWEAMLGRDPSFQTLATVRLQLR